MRQPPWMGWELPSLFSLGSSRAAAGCFPVAGRGICGVYHGKSSQNLPFLGLEKRPAHPGVEVWSPGWGKIRIILIRRGKNQDNPQVGWVGVGKRGLLLWIWGWSRELEGFGV